MLPIAGGSRRRHLGCVLKDDLRNFFFGFRVGRLWVQLRLTLVRGLLKILFACVVFEFGVFFLILGRISECCLRNWPLLHPAFDFDLGDCDGVRTCELVVNWFTLAIGLCQGLRLLVVLTQKREGISTDGFAVGFGVGDVF